MKKIKKNSTGIAFTGCKIVNLKGAKHYV